MFINTAEGQEVARGLSKQVVERFAPQELEMFDELYDGSLAVPAAALKARSEDELGFGAETLLVIATPVVSAVVQSVLSFLVTEVIKEETSDLIQSKLKALLNAKKGPAPLTQDQLLIVKKLAVRRAREMGMKEEKANQLALELVASLALER